jgi:hypothetical protein
MIAGDGSQPPRSFSPPLFAGGRLEGGFVVLLALAALIWPLRSHQHHEGRFLVVDPLGPARAERVFGPFVRLLSEELQHPLQMEVVANLPEWTARDGMAADLILCPDGAALAVPVERYTVLAVGRRHAPLNLRPRSVLVWRRDAGYVDAPWECRPLRTIMGDSLSLAGSGVLRSVAAGADRSAHHARGRWLAYGPDPYDHGPALHAARLGCFDYAVVRQHAAEQFMTQGWLDPRRWGIRELTDPLPDIVVLVSREWSAGDRVRAGEILVSLGRTVEDSQQLGQSAGLAGLEDIGLDGFNLLLEPDFERIRRQFHHDWPREVF